MKDEHELPAPLRTCLPGSRTIPLRAARENARDVFEVVVLHADEDELVVVIGGKVFSHANRPILFDEFTLEFGSGIVELQWQNGPVLRGSTRPDVEFYRVTRFFQSPAVECPYHSASEYQDLHFLSSFRTAGVPIGFQFLISFLL